MGIPHGQEELKSVWVVGHALKLSEPCSEIALVVVPPTVRPRCPQSPGYKHHSPEASSPTRGLVNEEPSSLRT